MVWRYDMWSRFAEPRLWWMHAMVGLWLLFMLMLFVLEPLVLHRAMAAPDPQARNFARMERVHRVLLVDTARRTSPVLGFPLRLDHAIQRHAHWDQV